MSNNAKARPAEVVGHRLLHDRVGRDLPDEEREEADEEHRGEPRHRDEPAERPASRLRGAPSRRAGADGATRSFSPCATMSPSTPPSRPTDARRPRRAPALRASLDEVLRVEREDEQPEPPELVAEHLEPRQPDRRGGTRGDLADALRDRAEHPSCLLGEARGVRTRLDVPELGRRPAPRSRGRRPRRARRPRRQDPARGERERDPHDLEERAAGLRERVALEQVPAGQHVGIAADFTASVTRITACAASSPRTSAAVAPTFPSVVPDPSGMRTATATTTDHRRGHDVGPPHHAPAFEPVDHDADEGRDQRVRDVQEQDTWSR